MYIPQLYTYIIIYIIYNIMIKYVIKGNHVNIHEPIY